MYAAGTGVERRRCGQRVTREDDRKDSLPIDLTRFTCDGLQEEMSERDKKVFNAKKRGGNK
jgi:hypothetical protein